jgi:hypothetical protein
MEGIVQGVLGEDVCVSPLRYDFTVVVFLPEKYTVEALLKLQELKVATGWVISLKPYTHNEFRGLSLFCQLPQGWGIEAVRANGAVDRLREWRLLCVQWVSKVFPEAKYWE